MSSTKLIVGLGNPGSKYNGTRHNAGFHFLDALAHHYEFPAFKEGFKSLMSEKTLDGQKIILLKPQTFMNLSGEALLQAAQFYKIPNTNICIIYDDIDLPLGEFRYREKGSAGSHNGMKSIIEQMGSEEIPRLRIGIDTEFRKEWQGSLSDFVLGPFAKEEQKILDEKIYGHLDDFFLKYPSL